MPFVLILVGFGLVSAAWRGQEDKLLGILKDDFTSQTNFVAWLVALIILGAIGSFWEDARPVTDAFLVLVVVALVVSQNGFWEKFKQQVLT